jgi:hypothetical protein
MASRVEGPVGTIDEAYRVRRMRGNGARSSRCLADPLRRFRVSSSRLRLQRRVASVGEGRGRWRRFHMALVSTDGKDAAGSSGGT